jgi:hypothetical protein
MIYFQVMTLKVELESRLHDHLESLSLENKQRDRCFINRLPVDILADILSYTITFDFLPRQRQEDLSLICKKWNETMQIGSLWKYLVIDERTNAKSLTYALERCPDSPLHVYFSGTQNLLRFSLKSVSEA